jgi:hypothetical protein
MTGAKLCKYADPIEGAREGLSAADAAEILCCDAGLLYCDVTPEGDAKLEGQELPDVARRMSAPEADSMHTIADVLAGAGYRHADRIRAYHGALRKLERLCDELRAFYDAYGLRQQSAADGLADIGGTGELAELQRAYLTNFIARWELAETEHNAVAGGWTL